MRHKLGIEHCMIHIELVNCLGGSAPCLKSVHRSIERSQTRRELVEDIYRIGRPITATSQANITRIRGFILSNSQKSDSAESGE